MLGQETGGRLVNVSQVHCKIRASMLGLFKGPFGVVRNWVEGWELRGPAAGAEAVDGAPS